MLNSPKRNCIRLSTVIVFTTLTVVGIGAGCSRSDNTASGTDTSRRAESQTLSPTSRDTDSTNRVYGNTNATSVKDADNTGRNVRDRNDASLTSGDQGNSDSDREITRKIRRSLTSNDQLSTVAKNIKIITQNGKVTLRGPVNSEQEKQTIAQTAQSAAGQNTIDNQLEVKGKN